MTEIGKRLREMRGDLTIPQAAKKAGVSMKSWYYWENKGGVPQEENAKKLATTFKRTVDWILDHRTEVTEASEVLKRLEALERAVEKIAAAKPDVVEEVARLNPAKKSRTGSRS